MLKDLHRVPSSLAVDTALNKFPFEMIDPVISLDEAENGTSFGLNFSCKQ